MIRVEDHLDADLDWSTFELADINLFGNYVIPVPAGLNHYETTVDLRPEGNNLLVRVTAGLDAETGVVEWLFESLDPESLAPPDDPMAGFLAVNDKLTHIGEGHIEYLVAAKSNLASGTEITNQALNYFDINAAVPTPTGGGNAHRKGGFGKLCATPDNKLLAYRLTVEADLLFHPEYTQPEEVMDLIQRITKTSSHLREIPSLSPEELESIYSEEEQRG